MFLRRQRISLISDEPLCAVHFLLESLDNLSLQGSLETEHVNMVDGFVDIVMTVNCSSFCATDMFVSLMCCFLIVLVKGRLLRTSKGLMIKSYPTDINPLT